MIDRTILWHWIHISCLSKDHRPECTCHYCIQLKEKGFIKMNNEWLVNFEI